MASNEQPKTKTKTRPVPKKLDLSTANGPTPPSTSKQIPLTVSCPICCLELPLLEAIKTHIREDHPTLYDPRLDNLNGRHTNLP
ncbi:hypothetical protein PTTG_04944 [Puccinia triticina 1-1 BBBD Race 1]|uniref:C2H2-type domain-containing protein n=2 Tax=Puccinia triticina TaxID=208348 RepID=A0A0C4EVV8_PUCT1|nr:uncharacterized protein PtA15_3A407 [Puccinia triticina]OAV92796.1 hypothetical protein PTTG_04944 [Puccinia triticina 1-1 BBBD Race 1]WAQ83041.1 hypothetical protein PtA15_3A407 [Puccinia triticina]WAR53875.1 hypothetical protein PtB15_3B384 [Puccinia triticina]